MTAAARMAGVRPWYREPWPWILMAIPAVSVVMGIVMVVLAIRSQDGLVTGDYYRQGLAINRVLAREAKARALGVRARIGFDATRTVIRVVFDRSMPRSRAIRLSLAHPTRAGLDQEALLTADAAGAWVGHIAAPPLAEKWHVVLEDPVAAWRLTGIWHAAADEIVLGESR